MMKSGLIIVMLLSICVINCGSDPEEKGKPVAAGKPTAKNTGSTLHLYTALDENEAKIYIRAFEEETGIKIISHRQSTGEILVRVRHERNNPHMGLWFGGPSPDFIAATQEGLLTPYKPNIDYELPPGTFDEDYHWTGFYFGPLCFANNTEILGRKGVEAPTSWYDLIKPEFEGEIGVAYAYTSGTSYTILATLVQLMGENEAFDYIEKLNKNIHHYNKSGSACVKQVAFGEIGVGIGFSHDVIKKGISKGFPVSMTFPKEGTGYEIGAIALIKGGPDQEEAKMFIDWILSIKAQNMMKVWFRTPLNPNATVVEGAVTADKVNLINFNAVAAGKSKRRLVERWREITAQ